jgi:hypothetical protein
MLQDTTGVCMYVMDLEMQRTRALELCYRRFLLAHPTAPPLHSHDFPLHVAERFLSENIAAHDDNQELMDILVRQFYAQQRARGNAARVEAPPTRAVWPHSRM